MICFAGVELQGELVLKSMSCLSSGSISCAFLLIELRSDRYLLIANFGRN